MKATIEALGDGRFRVEREGHSLIFNLSTNHGVLRLDQFLTGANRAKIGTEASPTQWQLDRAMQNEVDNWLKENNPQKSIRGVKIASDILSLMEELKI